MDTTENSMHGTAAAAPAQTDEVRLTLAEFEITRAQLMLAGTLTPAQPVLRDLSPFGC